LERDEQIALFQWAGYKGIDLLFHIPNGGSRNTIEAVNLKRQGVKAGVPDIFLPIARKGFHGLFIELKAGKGKITEKQGEWLKRLTEQGYFAVVCVGWDAAREVIEGYLKGESNGY
jgi:hypothetical protein